MKKLLLFILSFTLLTGYSAIAELVRIVVPQDVLDDYRRCVDNRVISEINSYKNEGCRRDSVEIILYHEQFILLHILIYKEKKDKCQYILVLFFGKVLCTNQLIIKSIKN